MACLCPLPSSYRRRCPGHPLPAPSHRPTALEIAAVSVWIRAKVAHDPQGFVLEVVAVVMVQPSKVLELHWEADAVASCHEKLPCSHEAGPALVPLVDAARIFTAFRSRAARAVSHPLAILSQAALQQVANRGNQLFGWRSVRRPWHRQPSSASLYLPPRPLSLPAPPRLRSPFHSRRNPQHKVPHPGKRLGNVAAR